MTHHDDDTEFMNRLRARLTEGRILASEDEWPRRSDLEDRYFRRRLAGEGSLKQCWEAEDLLCRRPAALLICREVRQEDELRFLHEVQLYARLRHDGVASLYDAGRTADGRLFYVAEFLQGRSLRDSLRSGLAQDQALALAGELLEVMAFAHSLGIHHIDLKPENLLIDDSGRLKVTDWELASTDSTPALRGLIRGTPGYMPPPEYQMSPGYRPERADMFAIGHILLEMLGDPHLPPDRRLAALEQGLRAMISGCLDLEGRGDASSLLADWRAWAAGFAPEVEHAGLLRQGLLLLRRHRGLVLRSAAAVLGTAILSLAYLNSLRSKQEALAAALTAEKQEKERRFALLQQNHGIILKALEASYAEGDMLQAGDYLRLLEPVSAAIPAWPLWKARVALRLGTGTPADAATLRRLGSSRDLQLAKLLAAPGEPEVLHDTLMKLAWRADAFSLQACFAALASRPPEPAAQAILAKMAEMNPEAVSPRLLFLRDNPLDGKIEKEIWRQCFAAVGSGQVTAGLRKQCRLGRQIALAKGREELARRWQECLPPNLALGCLAWSDGYNERAPELAVNGLKGPDDYWAAADWPRTLSIDLETRQALGRIDLWLPPGPRHYTFRIWGGDEPSGPRILLAQKLGTEPGSPGQAFSFKMPAGTLSRYVHVEMLSNSDNDSVHIYEVEVYR
ncbi:MAG: hypothetical protein RL095_628 [Verrucomicrobiota bacterium]|jgi:hypothetical protein